MEPPDFLYVDNKRLNDYIEWLSTPVTADKISTFKVELSLTGPKVTAEQSKVIREKSQADKIKFLIEYLQKHAALADGRITTPSIQLGKVKTFRLETCSAVRILVPPATPENLVPEDTGILTELLGFRLKPNPLEEQRLRSRLRKLREEALQAARRRLKGFEGLTIFFSDLSSAETDSKKGNHHLFLLLDVHRPDEPHQLLSAYSALVALYDDAGTELEKTVFHSISRSQINDPTSNFHRDFSSDPLHAFRKMGARVSYEKRVITTLYRLRTVLPERDGLFTTIGYPIFISSGSAF